MLTVLCALTGAPLPAAKFARRFDSGKPTWTLRSDPARVRLVYHRLDADRRIPDSAAESVRINVVNRQSRLHWEYDLPAAQVIDDLKARLWMRSSRAGISAYLRVVLPNHQDPRTGSVLSVDIHGADYTKTGRWQQLACDIDNRELKAQIRRLRARFGDTSISSQGMYVDRIVLKATWDAGVAEVNFHSLEFGPVFAPPNARKSPAPKIELASGSKRKPRFQLPLEFRMDRLSVNGYPFFPRIVAYHNEALDELKNAGVNVVWVPRYDDARLLSGLRRRGMWATATPPRTVARRGAQKASTLPIARYGTETAPILFWTVGARIPTSARPGVVRWLDDIRRADAGVDRPIMGDVLGLERIYSRHMSMLGVSRHILNTSLTFKQYRNWLEQRKRLARPGSFTWTWIQTEPSSANSRLRRAAGLRPIIVEPEQIRLQVYAALAAGYRGIGYWKSSRLDGELPGAKERKLAIAQLNLELDLLGPWLSTGTVAQQTPFYVQLSPADKIGQRRLDFRSSPREQAQRDALIRARAERAKRNARLSGELEAAVIRSEHGMLLLPIWYESDAQFAPGKMAGENATIVVEGVAESALAWEVTTTGVRSLVCERVTGGSRITIPRFDQTAAVILTSNRKLIEQLRSKIKKSGIIAKSARMSTELARLKLARVRKVDAELGELGYRQTDGPQLLLKAGHYVKQATAALERGDYHTARQLSSASMQLQRILQRSHWEQAIQSLSSPVSAPHTLCFQTLPDHWRMVEQLGRVRNDGAKDLLRSGDFEDLDTMIAEGWKHQQSGLKGVRAAAELYRSGFKSTYALRLVAIPERGTEAPQVVEKPPVVVTTPKLRVRSGQLVQISGMMRLVNPVLGSVEGVMVYDNIGGTGSALRYNGKTGWYRFSMIRAVPKTGDLTLTFALTGLGEVQIDNLRVVAHSPSRAREPAPSTGTGTNSGNWTKPFRFLNRLPKLPEIPGLGGRQ